MNALQQIFGQDFPAADKRPAIGAAVGWEPSDRAPGDVSRSLTPEKVDSIMQSANSGDTTRQCQLCAEIEEKNWDIAQALQTRRLAVAGLEWKVTPGDDSPKAKQAAEELEAELFQPAAAALPDGTMLNTMAETIAFELMGALLPGFAVSEIIWAASAKRMSIAGFNPIEQRHITFNASRAPLLILNQHPQGVALAPGKFIVHRHRSRGGDLARGGLIRPLAWLDVFSRLAGMKDLLRFIERYGMPFLVAKINDQAWATDRAKIQYLIRNFGSDGGACFTDAVQTELLQAANTTGDVYWKLLDYAAAAINKVVLGQVGTTGEGPGGLNNGAIQGAVRQDILAADAKMCGATLSAQLAAPWTMYNYGAGVAAPMIAPCLEDEEDLQASSTMLVNLSNAGFEADAAEVSERFGFKLTKKVVAASPPPFSGLPGNTAAMAAESPRNATGGTAGAVVAQDDLKRLEAAVLKEFGPAYAEQLKPLLAQGYPTMDALAAALNDFAVAAEVKARMADVIGRAALAADIRGRLGLGAASVELQPLPFSEALDFWAKKIPQDAAGKALMDQLGATVEQAQAYGLKVAGITETSTLNQIKADLQQAIAGQTTVDEFVRNSQLDYGLGAKHAETVVRTNVQTAFQYGHYQRLDAIREQMPIWAFDVVLDDRTSTTCRPLHGLAYPADHPIWNSLYPPNHFNCRTTIVAFESPEAAAAQGFRVVDAWPRDKDTGAYYMPAQGFQSNVGAVPSLDSILPE